MSWVCDDSGKKLQISVVLFSSFSRWGGGAFEGVFVATIQALNSLVVNRIKRSNLVTMLLGLTKISFVLL